MNNPIMPSSDPQRATLYTLQATEVYAGSGYHPAAQQLELIAPTVNPGEWLAKEYGSDPVPNFGCSMRRIPVYHVGRGATERFYFAIDPDLERILLVPFAEELKQQRSKAEKAEACRLGMLKERLAEQIAHSGTLRSIYDFQSANLLTRLWIALRPIKRWPVVSD